MTDPCRHARRAAVMLALLSSASLTLAADAEPSEAPLDALSRRITEQARELAALKRLLADQAAALEEMRRGLNQMRGDSTPAAASASATAPAATATAPEPASPQPSRVAPIFEQPGVLTPSGRTTVEPSLQYAYSSSNRIALVGYTVIPAILVGLIDVREVKRSTWTAALTTRHGLGPRFEIEAKLPYVSRRDTSIGREFLQGTSTDASVFDARGQGIGDVEFSGRYQLNAVPAEGAIYVASLRLKTRTGRDPFEVQTSRSVIGFRNDGIERALPTGSGFYGIQPGLSMLLPSDPAVFFGSVSYLHSVRRQNVTRATDQGEEPLGSIAPGGILGFNFGMGLALNDKSSFSIGYDHSSIGRTRQNGQVVADSVRLQLGTLLLGYAHRLDERRTLNLSLGAGLTRDTPDLTLTLRLPTMY